MRLNHLPTHPVTRLVSAKALLAYAHEMRRGLDFSNPDHWRIWLTACSYVRLASKLRAHEIQEYRKQRFMDYYT